MKQSSIVVTIAGIDKTVSKSWKIVFLCIFICFAVVLSIATTHAGEGRLQTPRLTPPTMRPPTRQPRTDSTPGQSLTPPSLGTERLQGAVRSPLPTPTQSSRQDRAFYRKLTDEEIKRIENLPSIPANCPVCRYPVQVPRVSTRAPDYDSDLCGHPVGRIRFVTAIPICPQCGFACRREDFLQMPRADEALKAWVEELLTPSIRETIRNIFVWDTEKMQLSDNELVSLYRQEDLPDFVRCEHSLAYYERLQIPESALAKMSLDAAWSYRRLLGEAPDGPMAMEGLGKVFKYHAREFPIENTLIDDPLQVIEKRLVAYDKIQNNSSANFTPMEMQLIHMQMAFCYERLGCFSWAKQNLEWAIDAAEDTTAHKDLWIASQPPDLPKVREERAALQRQVIYRGATGRLAALMREQVLLKKAADYMRQGLNKNQYRPEKLAETFYMIGQCEKRQERFTRAKEWFLAAEKLSAEEESTVAIFARPQLRMMESYMRDLKMRGYPADPEVAADLQIMRKYISQ